MEALINVIKRNGGFIKSNELAARKEREQLRTASHEGHILRLKNGLYAEAESLATNMIDVERIVPGGVLCLYSAFRHYNLSTIIPSSFCIAIEAKRKVRIPEYPLIDLYYWKKEYLGFGIIERTIAGHKVRITDLERTVCDTVRYRNKIGMDICGEVLNNYLVLPNRNIPLLHEYATKLRVNNILNLYLQTRL